MGKIACIILAGPVQHSGLYKGKAGGDVRTEAEVTVMWPQAKECGHLLQKLEKARKWILPYSFQNGMQPS